jgi:hypothetical protein
MLNRRRILNSQFEKLSLKIILFWGMTPCSLVESYQLSGGNCYLLLQGRRLLYNKYQNKRRQIPENHTLLMHRHENIKASVYFMKLFRHLA